MTFRSVRYPFAFLLATTCLFGTRALAGDAAVGEEISTLPHGPAATGDCQQVCREGTPVPSPAEESAGDDWSFHLQNTDIFEYAAPFHADYSGQHSLGNNGVTQETVSVDFYVARRLWEGAQLNGDFLIWQGYGLSTSFGIENFPDADAYKAGTKAPNYMLSHLSFQQTFGFGGEQEDVDDGPMSLAGKEDISRLTLVVGRMSVLDMFDHNKYAQDGHTQFMSWGGQANMTWDYGQDTIGYETGFMAELNERDWALRYSFFLMPPYINANNTGSGDGGDDEMLTWPNRGKYGPFFKSWGQAVEWEGRFAIHDHPGTVRLLGWADQAKSVDYDLGAEVLRTLGASTDLTPYEAYHYSYGVGLNLEQEITPEVGVFSRIGWNDGKTQALEYTDTNWTISVGASFNGALWGRPKDSFGIAGFLDGASAANQRYLQAGGVGILDGDGQLTYGVEKSLTPYYDFEATQGVHLAVQYQFTVDPAFNRDRGPASTFMFRFHFEV